MFSCTSVCLRVPSMAAVSILGWFPQSAQYMVLRRNTHSSTLHTRYIETKQWWQWHVSCVCGTEPGAASHPLCGSSTMAYGSSIMPEMRVLQFCPDIWATSMTSRPESVQYRLPATQSTAIPRGIFSSWIWSGRITVFTPYSRVPAVVVWGVLLWPLLPAGWWSGPRSAVGSGESWRRWRTTWPVPAARRRRCGPCASWSRRCGWSWRAGPWRRCARWRRLGRSARSASWACQGPGCGFHCRQLCTESVCCCSCLGGGGGEQKLALGINNHDGKLMKSPKGGKRTHCRPCRCRWSWWSICGSCTCGSLWCCCRCGSRLRTADTRSCLDRSGGPSSWSPVCRSRRSRCRWWHSAPRLRRRTESCCSCSRSAWCLENKQVKDESVGFCVWNFLL